MINKKLFVLSFLFFVCMVGYLYAAENKKNFVTLLNGGTHTVVSGTSGKPGNSEYSFIGQSVVFDEKDGTNITSRSAFGSAFYIVQSSSITFTNETEDKVYEDIMVELKVNIKSDAGNITKIKYRVWQGENPDWNDYNKCPELSFTDFSPAKNITVISTFNFSDGQPYNYFKFYAQTDNDSKRWSEVYRVRLTPELSSDIRFTSPDSVTAVASVNPKIETTRFSLSFKPVTISLCEGTEQSPVGDPIYTVDLDTKTVQGYNIYDSTDSFISCDSSELYKLYKEIPPSSSETFKLEANKQYFLKIYPTGSTSKKDVVEFKVISDGVAKIVTYPSPFNPKKQKVKIKYVLANDKKVTIRLYDKAGKVVCKLVDGEQRSAGTNEEEWDGRNYAGDTLATGAYIVEIIAGSDRRYTALAIVGK